MDNLTPEQIQAMIAMLQNMLPKEASPEETEPATQASAEPKKANKNKAVKNKFCDMPEVNMHKEDKLIDSKLCVQPPVPRARPFNFISATCRMCGRKEKVNPKLIHESIDRYKCNKCSASSG